MGTVLIFSLEISTVTDGIGYGRKSNQLTEPFYLEDDAKNKLSR